MSALKMFAWGLGEIVQCPFDVSVNLVSELYKPQALHRLSVDFQYPNSQKSQDPVLVTS